MCVCVVSQSEILFDQNEYILNTNCILQILYTPDQLQQCNSQTISSYRNLSMAYFLQKYWQEDRYLLVQ